MTILQGMQKKWGRYTTRLTEITAYFAAIHTHQTLYMKPSEAIVFRVLMDSN